MAWRGQHCWKNLVRPYLLKQPIITKISDY